MAERVGFEPTCRLPDKTLSRRPRYDHFGTSPDKPRSNPGVPPSFRSWPLGYSEIRALAPCSEEPLHQLARFVGEHALNDLYPMIE